jgi:hypothetical protein
MSWNRSFYQGEVEPRGNQVYVYWSGRSGGHATISVGYEVRSAYWSGDEVMVILSNGERRKYRDSCSWGRS